MTLQPSATAPVPTTTLKTYWCAKRNLSQTQAQLAKYHAPLVWHMADAAASTVIRHFPRSGRALKLLFHHWRVTLSFRQQDRALRRRVRQHKVQHVDQLTQQAQTTHSSSLQGLYQLSKQLRPKAPKRSIHFRDATGMLLGSAEEIKILQDYFEELYQSFAAPQSDWRLTVPFQVTTEEAAEALHHTSGRKALPHGQVPAVLWKTAEPLLAETISRDLNAALQPGPICLPDDWNCAYLALLPKPNKPPCQPANLRPISILPMLPKLLARIAASRLKPCLLAALQEVPQFAYMMGRQVNDALDRVISHCFSVRELLKGGSRSVFRLQEGRRDPLLRGGMQLSLDLSKAYDKLPRCFLLQTLERVGAPAELISLIMYIHDNAIIVITKSAESAHIRMGRGIRQGCGLSPMLWLGFTLSLFDKLHAVLPDNTLTGYADDFHALWQFEHPRDFRNAIGHIPRIMEVLRFYGMDIALDKTAILLAIQGRAAPHLLRDFTAIVKGHRCLVIRHPNGNLSIPIKTSHPYLGVHIGYHSFEQATVKHRLAQSWVAFHRLHVFLKHNQIPLKKRMQLWLACVWSIIQHGLTSTGLDHVSTSLLLAQTSKQLRMVARSPAHVHHETNAALYARLCWDGPLPQLLRAATKRVTSSRATVGHLQPARVHQWWELAVRSFQPTFLPDSPARLTEVTNVLQLRSMCPVCGVGFPSNHAVNVHIGKQHQDVRKPREPSSAIKNRNNDAARAHALHGMPTCRHCLKSFHGWPQFFGHIHQEACPILHAHRPVHTPTPPSDTAPTSSQLVDSSLAQRAFAPEEAAATHPEIVPLFHRTALQTVARAQDLRELAKQISSSGSLNHCPECYQWCTSPAYVSRHAVKAHPLVRQHQESVLSWLKQRGNLLRPCEFCDSWYQVRPSTHVLNCPVLWACGHLFARFSSLTDTRQATLHGFFRRRPAASGGDSRAGSVQQAHGVSDSVVHETPLHSGGDSPGHGRGPGQAVNGLRGPGYADSSKVCQGRRQRRPDSRADGQRERPDDDQPGTRGRPVPAEATAGQQASEAFLEPTGPSQPDTSRRTVDLAQPLRQPLRPPRARRPDQRAGRSGGKVDSQAGGPDGGEQPRQRVCALLPNQVQPQPLVNHRQSLQSRDRLEVPEGIQSREPHAAHAERDAVLRPQQHATDDAPPRGPGPAGHDPAREGVEPHRGQYVPVHALESGYPGSREGSSRSPRAHRGRRNGLSDDDLHGVPGRRWQIPCPAPSDGESPVGRDPVCARPPEPIGGQPRDVQNDATPLSQCSDTPGRHDCPASEIGPLPVGPERRPPGPAAVSLDPSAVLTLKLQNRRSHCYANSSVLALMWSMTEPESSDRHRPDGVPVADRSFGRLIRWMGRGSATVELWEVKSWQRLVTTWENPHRQHDVAEFLQFLSRLFCVPAMLGAWHALQSTAENVLQVCDHGHFWPLLVPAVLEASLIPNQPYTTLQRLVILWRNQAAVHAARSAETLPALFPLQVNRFSEAGEKLRTVIQPSEAVYIPYFVEDGIRTASCRYRLVAIIFHLGSSKLQGHYRTALLQHGRLQFITDDNVCATTVSDAVSRLVNQNSYVFILKKCEAQQ